VDGQASASFKRELRGALRYLYDPINLRKSPLIALFDLTQQQDPPSALRRILVDGIEALKPGTDVPLQTEAWRIYQILFRRHVEHFAQREVATELSISTRHVRREEALALDVLANHLWTRYGLESTWQDDQAMLSLVEEEIPLAEAQTPDQEQEIEWLRASLSSEPTDIEQVIRAAVQTIAPLAKASAVHLHCTLSENLPRLAVQPTITRQALLGILTTAMRCVPHGQVYIEAEKRDRHVCIRITPEKQEGAALSLPDKKAKSLEMAQRLIELSGGWLTVAPGRSSKEPFSAECMLPAIGQVPVLVIDDNIDTLQLLRRYLSGTRYRFSGAHDPEQALALIEELVPRVIVLDVMLPGIDGWELLGRLREHPRTRHVPIIVCTILPEEQLALSLGAAAFLSKPVGRKPLLSALDRQVDRSVREPE
jgi:CheY-like chemotaxis protein